MQNRSQKLIERLNNKILVIDGAMGTAIQDLNLSAKDFGGDKYEGCNEYLVITKPQVISKIHEDYLKAGCDIIETNTFGGTPLVLDEYDLGSRAREINLAAAQIARKIADQYSTKDHPRFVAGSMGPTTKAISVTGGVTFEALQDHFAAQAEALIEGGVDYLLLETCQDTRNIKAAFLGIEKVKEKLKSQIPVAVSITIEPTGTMLAGQSVEALYSALSHQELLYLGLNCATGPEFMTDHIRTLSSLSHFRLGCVPNAGLPDENGCYLETPEMIAKVLSRFLSNGWLNVIGGCCGTHPEHIRELVKIAGANKARTPATNNKSHLSGIDYVEMTNDLRPVIVGERTNVIGSKKFKTLVCENKFEEASEVARVQIKNGAHLIDVCLANPDRDEHEDMKSFLEIAIKKIKTPVMIDSTDEKVVELALTYCQGKAIINSVNLEDGEERFEKIIPLAKKFGAALVVGTIDDDPNQGMGVSRQRKLEIADRSYKLLTEKYGILPQDIYWDPLVFPCGTGDAQYVGSAAETIEGIRLIKAKYPETKSVLGISNVSFGLPPAGREVLNSVFLYHCVQAGLDLAIVNSEKLERYAGIGEKEKELSEDLIFNRGKDPVAAFTAHFRELSGTKKVQSKTKLPLMERLPNYIVEGSKDGLIDDLNEVLKTMKPLDIINGPLMKGMDEVGRLFNANQMIVAEVLQSAESMKAAVQHLEPFMEKTEANNRGKVLLATVKGDVHDIGKNLVEIILANNGFNVVNLGIKIPPEQLINAIKEHKPNIVGLSGLLVKSAQQMVTTAEDLSKAGIQTPILVGGAALTSNFVDREISKAYTTGTVAYAKDAMNGLDLAKSIVHPDKFEELKQKLSERRSQMVKNNVNTETNIPISTTRSKKVAFLPPLLPPDFNRHVIKNTPIDHIWKFVNPLMLYGRHLGIKGGIVRELEKAATDKSLRKKLKETEPKSLDIWDTVQEVKEEFKDTKTLQVNAVYSFFQAKSKGNSIELFNSSKPLTSFSFPRQRSEDGLCLSDYVTSDSMDSMAAFVVTCGKGIRLVAENMKSRGEYLKSHIIQALALETAEAYAELLHSQIRKTWGFPDAPEMTMMERFQAKYRGKRYSFGYPACPKLDDQALLWKILKPEEIGVQLTEGFMMDPESSVSAIVFHHPDAIYFSVGQTTGGRNEDNR
jgi:5-methyltetrahydrofolate--homocysteine methyltransferase